jgi:hypothetical protein
MRTLMAGKVALGHPIFRQVPTDIYWALLNTTDGTALSQLTPGKKEHRYLQSF